LKLVEKQIIILFAIFKIDKDGFSARVFALQAWAVLFLVMMENPTDFR
jgi:hypothetical protein